MRVIPIATFLIALFPFAAADAAAHRHLKHGSSSPVLTSDSINAAAPQGASSDPALIVKTEVLLDRDGFSPGEIDGKNGDNFRKALAAFQQARNFAASGTLDAETWSALLSDNTDPPLTSYTISETDVAGHSTNASLVLLCHEFLRRDGPAIGALQQGHRDRVLTRAPISRRRMVAMEFGM